VFGKKKPRQDLLLAFLFFLGLCPLPNLLRRRALPMPRRKLPIVPLPGVRAPVMLLTGAAPQTPALPDPAAAAVLTFVPTPAETPI
jgi:hypothetical protein